MRCIIIGAFDGVSFDDIFNKLSNEDEVIFVEPIEYYYKILKLNALDLDSKCHFENIAISDKTEDLQITHVDLPYVSKYQSFYMGCSSVVVDGKPINRYLHEVNEEHLKTINVKAITFEDLCAKYGWNSVDYVQIDCEGYDQRIVKSIDLEKYGIKKLKFETHYLEPNFIADFAQKWQNYRYEIDQGDVIFYHL